MIQLHHDPIQLGVHVDELPLWLAPTGGSYWHIPRSALRRDDGRLSINFWCGSGRSYPAGADPIEVPAPEEMKCGTCVGRFLGYGREAGQIFRPRDAWALPARCPGNDWDGGTRNCHACGRPTNTARGWTSYGIADHKPWPELAERLTPCPRHGWLTIYSRGGRFVCSTWHCEHIAG